MKASEVIREARNVLFERGWHQGSWEDESDGSVCIRGALGVAVCGDARGVLLNNDAYRVDALVAGALGVGNAAAWNDSSTRTFTDIVDALDRAEKIAEQRESDA